MAEPKFKRGDRVRFVMRFADPATEPAPMTGEVLDATTINAETPEGFYRVRSELGVALLLPEEDLSRG